MYKHRLHIFILFCILTISVSIVRLMHLQTAKYEDARKQIENMRILPPVQLPTIRGTIYDRNGNIIAEDKPEFYLQIKYQITKLADDRVWQGMIAKRTSQDTSAQQAEKELREELTDDVRMLDTVIDECIKITDLTHEQIQQEITEINDRIWQTRQFLAWMHELPDSKVLEKHGTNVLYRIAMDDFKRQCPDSAERLKLTMKEDIAEMYQSWPLVDLATDEQLIEAQGRFANINAVEILPKAKRIYPYRSAACQVIGWVGPAQENEKYLFIGDKYSSYLRDELTGKAGVERICETVLRGRRGEVRYNKDDELISYMETRFGQDVTLTLDIELQSSIEEFLADPDQNPTADDATGAVVIDVTTGDVLAVVSMPVYDLNTVRRNFNEIRDAPGAPMVSKALAEHYPPGSTIKPFILAAGLEEGYIRKDEVINCPYENQKKKYRFPNCLMFSKFNSCHDYRWQNEGGNIARNAIRGSCNVYFSRLANRIDAASLQKWFYNFGFGHKILPGPALEGKLSKLGRDNVTDRNLPQSAGLISTELPQPGTGQLKDLPVIAVWEKRNFGIGQGNLRTSVLQLANALAALARGGVYKNPRLFSDESASADDYPTLLPISRRSLDVIRDGMHAVVTEEGGSAYKKFKNSNLKQKDIKLFGKTGSPTDPDHACFICFAEDSSSKVISIAVIVEGGQSGAQDAAPIARRILELCNEAGYIGIKPPEAEE